MKIKDILPIIQQLEDPSKDELIDFFGDIIGESFYNDWKSTNFSFNNFILSLIDQIKSETGEVNEI